MQNDNNRKAILAVSFGTSHNSSRSITIGAIESTIRERFPGFEVRRAFTSGMIISKLKKRDGISIDNVSEALKKLEDDGFTKVCIQPTHMIEGDEYDLIAQIADEYRSRFETLKLGHALLTTDEDLDRLTDIIASITDPHEGTDTARVFMGHGTEHAANEIYERLQKRITERGINNILIGTVEASPTIKDIAKKLKGTEYKKVILSPLMIVAGDHAVNDMAGDDEDSWKSILEKEGFEVICRIRGLGSDYEVQQMIADHCSALVK